MAKLITVKGIEVDLTDEEYVRFRNKAKKTGGEGFQELANGTIIKVDQIAAIIPDRSDFVKEVMAVEVVPEVPVKEPEATGKNSNTILTVDQMNQIIEGSELNQSAFAASVGYSSATLRMTKKEGKLTQPFSDAIMKKYGDVLAADTADTTKE